MSSNSDHALLATSEISGSYVNIPERSKLSHPLPYSFQGSISPQTPQYHEPIGWLDNSLFLTETRLTSQVGDITLHRVDSSSSTCSDPGLTPLSSSFSSIQDAVSSDSGTSLVKLGNKRSTSGSRRRLDAAIAKTLVKIIRRYTFMPQLVYSLLIGRPVVVLADMSNEELVHTIIKSLTFFLPEHVWRSSSVVIGWITGPLHISLLANAKLIGLAKTSGSVPSIPNAVRCYVSIFDVDNATLIAPQYDGLILHDLLDSRKVWPDVDSFVEYFHGVGLTLCSLAFTRFSAVFASYELGIVEHNYSKMAGTWQGKDAIVNVKKSSAIHCDLHHHDIAIIDSLVTILKHLLLQSDENGYDDPISKPHGRNHEQHSSSAFEMKLNRSKCVKSSVKRK